jgi:hypothetical protein
MVVFLETGDMGTETDVLPWDNAMGGTYISNLGRPSEAPARA